MKRSRRHDSPVLTETFLDVSGGINGGVSDAGALIRHDKNSDNIVYEPARARSSRDGFRALTSLLLPYPPTSTMRYYGASGITKTFEAAGTKIYLIENGGGFVEQTLPITPSDGGKWSHANLNGILVCAQEGGSNTPIFYNGTEWLSCVFPTPAGTPVFSLTDNDTGVVDAGQHYWRIRFRFSNGASLACAGIAHTADGSKTMVLSGITPSTRSDYLGFSVERTILGEPGLWYVVGDSAAKTDTTYIDNTADADLGDLVPAEPGVFGSAPHFDGVIAHADLLFGWVNSNLYVSDAIGADYGCGCLNFHPFYYQVKADDGDPIKLAVQQLDRLVIIKGASMHAFTGFDRDSFACTQIHGSIGTPSTRGAAADGARVFIYGGRGRIFVLDGQTVRGLGNPQITHYLDEIALTGENMVEVVNYRGDKILFAYPSVSSPTNDEVLAYSMPDRNWEHHTGIRICGSLCPKNDYEFGGATMVYGDPKLYSADAALDPAKWTANGIGVCESLEQQAAAKCVPDGLGGSIVVWFDSRSTGIGVYAQRISAAGVSLWAENGICLTTSPAGGSPCAIADGLGGAIIAWNDRRNGAYYDIYAQKIDQNGVAQWTANGVVVKNATTNASLGAGIVSDGAGGVILAWQDFRRGFMDVYAQRISSSGVAKWQPNGVVVNAGVYAIQQGIGVIAVSDGVGGAIIAWEDYRSDIHIYAQRINSSGSVQWTANGVVVCNASHYQTFPIATTDGAGGAIVAWMDYRSGTGYDIYAQRVTSTGSVSWVANGVVVCDAATDVGSPCIIDDGVGGAIIAWYGSAGISAQRVSSAGVLLWLAAGVVLGPLDRYVNQLVSDGAGGVIAMWGTTRTGGVWDIYAQWVSGAGVVQWDAGGLVVCSATGNQSYQNACSDGTDGAIVVWADARAGGSNYNIYAQHIDTTNSSLVPGYHLWSLFDGETDEAAFDGSGGIPIPIMFETPEYDAGEPDVMKSFDRLQLYTKQGAATFAARLTTESGAANVTFAVNQVDTTWAGAVLTATSLIWGTGIWAGTKPGEATTGIPSGALGKRCKLRITAEVSKKVLLLGHALDFQLLPERTYL